MKKTIATLLAALAAVAVSAQDIRLPEPRRKGGMPLMEALDMRRSGRQFADRDLQPQTLSDLLWAAWGYNRPKKRTAPSSRDKQEIEIYVAMKSGLYLYDAAGNILKRVSDDDIRSQTGTQPFAGKAPVNLVYVSDTRKITGKNHDEMIAATYANTGFIAQNVYLFCASEGLATVVRAMVDREKLARIMGLGDGCTITLVQTVGYHELL